MRAVFLPAWAGVFCAAILALPLTSNAQEDPFRWMDFHAQKDQDIVVWVSRALGAEKWSAIREIGVEYDAALVVTTLRSAPDAPPAGDAVSVWSISLTNHAITPLLKGYNLRWINPMTMIEGEQPEPAILYDSCAQCAADTYFTTFYYDRPQHVWAARWVSGGHGVAVWHDTAPAGVDWNLTYAALAEPNGRMMLGTWAHFDYGSQKPAEDYVYRYDVDPFGHVERAQLLSGREADTTKTKICRADSSTGLARGQDSAYCRDLLGLPRVERKPVTTPPAHNRGRSVPPGTVRKPAH